MSLIEALQNAEVGNMELDAIIDRDIMGGKVYEWPSEFHAEHETIRPPVNYTTSIDSAVTLIPDGWWWSINSFGPAAIPNQSGFTAFVWSVAGKEQGTARTAALAICIAALKAR